MPPTMEDNAADGMFSIRKSLETKGVPEEARRISQRNQSWRESTRSQYASKSGQHFVVKGTLILMTYL